MKPSDRRESLLGPQSTGLAAALLKAAGDLTTSDKAKREGYLAEKFELGGRPFVERVKKYGRNEKDVEIDFSPWLEELLEAIGDPRIAHTVTIACSQLTKTLSHILLACDIQTIGRQVFSMVYDKKEARNKFQATQFKPVLRYWLKRLQVDGYNFDRSKDTCNASRNEVDGVNSIFEFASTADAGLRDGKSAVSSALAGWNTDWMLQEEQTQWPPGAVDIAFARLDYSCVATKPVRGWGTPGAGAGIETEIPGADYHFYPHAVCDDCDRSFPLDAFGALLKKHTRTDAFGQVSDSYVSVSNRPVEWFHHDTEDPIGSAYFGCPHCGEELAEETRVNARFRCLNTGIFLRDFIDGLPKDIPTKRYKVIMGYGPLLRRTKINLASDLIRRGLTMADAADWVQQGLGHPTEAGSSKLTLPVLKRAIDAPPASRIPELRLAGIDQGVNGYFTNIVDISLPEGWRSMPVEKVTESAVRTIIFSGEVMVSAIAAKLKEFNVVYGGVDNEPNRTLAAELQRSTCLEMMDQITGLKDAFKKTKVRQGDNAEFPCLQIRNEKYLRQVMNSFLLVDEDNHPLVRLPDDWSRWLSNPSERSPLRHFMGVKCDPETGKWSKTDTANGLYYAQMFVEASLYIWLSRGGEGGGVDSGGYVPGVLVSVQQPGRRLGGRGRYRARNGGR